MSKLFLIIILLVASFLRLGGVNPGYPPYHSDEDMSYSQAISMIQEKNLNANGYSLHYSYPYLVPWIQYLSFKHFFIPISWIMYYFKNTPQIINGETKLPFSDIDYLKVWRSEIVGTREVNVLAWGRYVTAVFGVGVVFLTYILGKNLVSERFGLLSAFLIAINYKHVLASHLSLPDIYNSFFLVLALIASLPIWTKGTISSYVLAGISTALAFSVKFQNYCLLPFFLSHLYSSLKEKSIYRIIGKLILSRGFIIAILTIITATLLINPFHVINFEQMRDQLIFVATKYGFGSNKVELFIVSYMYHIGVGGVLSIISLMGICTWVIKDFKKAFYILFPVLVSIYTLTYYTRGGFYTRNIVSILPLICMFAAYCLLFLYDKINIYSSNKD